MVKDPVPALSSPQRQWILRHAVLGAAVVNAAINAAIAWAMAGHLRTVPLWQLSPSGQPSTLTDSVGTLFFLPLITTAVFTSTVWRALRSGRLEPLPSIRLGLMTRVCGGRLRRGLTLGGLCVAAISPVTAAVLVAINFDGVSAASFVLYKTGFAVVLGALVTPLIATRAMADG